MIAVFRMPPDSLTGKEKCEWIVSRIGEVFGYEMDANHIRLQTFDNSIQVWAEGLYLGFIQEGVLHFRPSYKGNELAEPFQPTSVDCREYGCSGVH